MEGSNQSDSYEPDPHLSVVSHIYHELPCEDPHLARLQSQLRHTRNGPESVVFDTESGLWFFEVEFLTVGESVEAARGFFR